MKKIFLILPFLLIGTAHAASMCVPTIASNQSVSYIASVDGNNNRGYFAVGTSCVSGTTMCKSTLVRGEGHCSVASILPSDRLETNGPYCYCRLTHVRAPNGYVAIREGGWVFYKTYSGSSECVWGCTQHCAADFRSKMEFRRTLLSAAIESE